MTAGEHAVHRAGTRQRGVGTDNSHPQFCDAIRAAGLEPPEIIEPGKMHRFPGVGKRPSNRAGWCIEFDDGGGGCFGDFSTGLLENWQAKRDKPFTRSERATFMRRVSESRAQAEDKLKTRQTNAANRAAAIWNAVSPAPADHPYLLRKKIKPHGARLHKGALVLPVTDFDSNISSLQFINADGSKLLLKGARKKGRCIVVGGPDEPLRVIVCEGWGTGATLAEDEPESLALAAIDAGNLKHVAIAARRRWPSAELVIAGDDDRLTAGNPGATKARAAAFASGALVAFPEWPAGAPETLTDFNDLACYMAGGVA